MTLPSPTPAGKGPAVRLRAGAVAVPALASAVRPSLVLPERESRALLAGAAAHNVLSGGCFAASPAGVALWSGPFDGIGESPGSAVLLGSVDWTYDSPSRHYVTVHRAMVTREGVDSGVTTLQVLTRVLALGGLPVDGARVSLPAPPAGDPFRRAFTPAMLTPEQRQLAGF